MKWRAYPEAPKGTPSKRAILSDCGRWSVARLGNFPSERFEVWERQGESWTRRGDWPTAGEAKARCEA